MKKVLFICSHNSARSQMAEALTNSLLRPEVQAYSAGTKASYVHPIAIQVMREIGIDISNAKSKSTKEFMGQTFDLVVTVCDSAKEECPFFPGAKRYAHSSFEDPAAATGSDEEVLAVFREVRDEIQQWVVNELRGLLEEKSKDSLN